MKARPGIVIDASIARACGTSRTPPSPECARLLESVLAADCVAHLSRELRAEWGKHASRYFDRWWKVMTSRRRIEPRQLTGLTSLINRLHDVAPSREASAMIKDAHLAQAAIEHDGRVAALDETVRELFAKTRAQIVELGGVLWVNPSHAEEQAVDWVERGLPDEPARRLESWGQE